jgi:Flp pilus assembly protein TadD
MRRALPRGAAPLAALFILAAVVLAAYWQAPLNGFYFDDWENVVERPEVRMAEPTAANLWRAWSEPLHPWRKLPNLSFALDWWRGGGEPAAFLATNVAIHLAAAAALLLLLNAALRACAIPRRERLLAALLAAAVWAAHPIQSQAVTYVVQRMAELSALFALLSVWAYVQARRSGRRRWFAGAGLAFACGVLSKENAWIVPLLWWLAEFSVCRPSGPLLVHARDRLLFFAPFALGALALADLASGAGPLARFVQAGYEGRSFTLAERLLTQPRVVLFHVSQILWPLPGRFSLEHDFRVSRALLDPGSTLASILALLAWCGAGLAALLRARSRVLGFFMLWLPVTLAVESSVIALEMMFEHRMYLPSAGLAGLLALALAGIMRRGRPAQFAVAGLGALLVAGLVSATQARVAVWREPLTLFADVVQKAPSSGRAWAHYGDALYRAGRSAEAERALRRALELDAQQWGGYEKLGLIHMDRDELREAERLLRQAVRVSAGYHSTLNHLAEVLLRVERGEEARALFARAAEAAPWEPEYRWNLAIALERGGDCAGALAQWEAYLKLEQKADDRDAVARHIEENWRRSGGGCAGGARGR